jgi:dephospho-CoA kinase
MIIGLTGGIGSGKSTVGKLFELMGCQLISSDEIAKKLYYKPSIKERVIALLGEGAYTNENTINKNYIREKIFNNRETLEALNQILHPEVKKELALFFKQYPNQIIIKESALLFEAALDKEVDRIIVVAADDNLRIKRVMQRDHQSYEYVLKQFNAQLKQEEKIKKAHFVIYNNEEHSLIEQVIHVIEEIKKQFN